MWVDHSWLPNWFAVPFIPIHLMEDPCNCRLRKIHDKKYPPCITQPTLLANHTANRVHGHTLGKCNPHVNASRCV